MDNLFCLFQVRNKKRHLLKHPQMMEREAEMQQQRRARQKPLEPGHHLIPSSRSLFDRVALLWTPSAACAPSCCRFETSGWATTRMRPSFSSTAVGLVPTFVPTTTSLLPTCCSVGCSLSQHPGSCGTTRPAAGPPTTRTWLFSITRIAGTRWRSCRPRAAAAWDRQPAVRERRGGGSGVRWFVRMNGF